MIEETKIAVFHHEFKGENGSSHTYEFVLNPPKDMIMQNEMYLVSIHPVDEEIAKNINFKKIRMRQGIARVNYIQQGHAAMRTARHGPLLKADLIAPGLAALCDSLAQNHLREEFKVERILLSLPRSKGPG